MDFKDTEKNSIPSNGQNIAEQSINAFYNKHSSLSVIAKKTERITTAIYMVTDFIQDSEPLKIQLRTLAITLVSGTRKLQARGGDTTLADDIIRTIEETVVFLRLATTIGLLSDMNGTILLTEIVKVQNAVREQCGEKSVLVSTHPGYANIVLSPAMFEVESGEQKPQSFSQGQDLNKGHEKTNNVLYKNTEKTTVSYVSVSRKNDLGSKIARRNDVLTVVRNKGKVSIKDISQILKDTSDKTIQRELHGLVQEGVLVKEGEKRWSMYRIAS